jgi:hypothetical protein
MRTLAFLFCITTSLSAGAQANTARAAFTRLQKGEFSAARQLLQKSMRKEISVAQHYTWAWYFSFPSHPDFQVDSAHFYSRLARVSWQAATAEARNEWARFPIDSVRLLELQQRIDSLAFDRARQENTEAAYQFFVAHFGSASQRERALELAAEAGYLEALKLNSIAGYRAFADRYPNFHQADDARYRLDKLQFEYDTRSGTLSAFQQFYKQYPASRFRHQALEKIFRLQTVSGKPSDLLSFLETYRYTDLARHAAALLFYVDSTQQKNRTLFPDSLLRLQELNRSYWVPFLRGEKFGFLNDRGEVVMSERFTSLPMAYRCEPVTTDFITADGQLFLRNGKALAREAVKQVVEIGGGFVLLELASTSNVLHKTGFVFMTDVQAAKWLANQYLAIRLQGRWGVFAINGVPLVSPEFEDVDATSSALVLHRNGKRVLVPWSELPRVASGTPLPLNLVYDDVKDWGNGRLWVKNGSLEGMLNEKLAFEIPLARQRLVRTSFGYLQVENEQTRVVGLGPEMAREQFQRVQVAEPWLIVQQTGGRAVYSMPAQKFLAQQLDSVWFAGKNAWGQRGDSTFLFSATRQVTAYTQGTALEFVASADSVRSFLLQEKSKLAVYQLASGRKQFTLVCDKMQQAGDYFIITQKNKRGLLDLTGKVILPSEYDEIVFQAPGFFSLVKNKLFGWYDAGLSKLTKPVYNRNVRFLGSDLFMTGQGGKMGVLTRSGNTVFPFELEDVAAWTDSLLWIRKNQFWQLVHWPTGKVHLDRVRSFQTIHEAADEKCVLVKREGGEGVWSSRQGELIPATFTEVINLGDESVPLYMAAKNVKEAGIVVVAYFNQRGQLVRRQAYENEEIERLVCDEE